ncbi:hypothetical protein OG883_40485 [Streptomyces sp. NBC_01142]|uniref:hypothetical protein n=1 Tax=Streptomyces sp. NBC_01142 TaxID=2975865 RepID=UPI002258CE49|nr:hypothetical protein [Streptomyces sp. NBC_01142]MCX4825965.1 hypothetical protein [Streptomyces sp. NBC_01142]
MTGALATAFLTGISLIGSPTPARAADGNTFFKTEQEVFNFLNQSAPLNQKEAVKGYPASGQGSQEVKLDDVEKAYPHDQALKDVPSVLGSGFNLPQSIPTEDPDIRRSSSDDKEPWLSNWDAKSMCGQPSHTQGGEPMPCGFVGVLDKAYPTMQTSAAVMGKAQFSQDRGHGRPGHQPDQRLVCRRKGHLTTDHPRRAGRRQCRNGAQLHLQRVDHHHQQVDDHDRAEQHL